MKKIILATTIMIAGLASAKNTPKEPASSPKKITNSVSAKAKVSLCTVSCSTSVQIGMNTLTITSSAGSIFTSCETASQNCTKKLMRKVLDLSMATE
jgi:hypothetical protein